MRVSLITILLASAVGSVMSIDCSLLQCVTNWEPVCGNDGVTYGNECELEIANCYYNNITLAYNGTCRKIFYNSYNLKDEFNCNRYAKISRCSQENQSVCGSDRKTYSNPCTLCKAIFENSDLRLVHRGRCREHQRVMKTTEETNCVGFFKDTQCTEDKALICGNDGVTYLNECKFCNAYYSLKEENFDLKNRHSGACSLDEYCAGWKSTCTTDACRLKYQPLCAPNGKTYANWCHFCGSSFAIREKRETFKISKGICKDESASVVVHDETEDECSKEERLAVCSEYILGYKPVCGSDGQTYENKCQFCLMTAETTDIHVAHSGICEKRTEITTAPSVKDVECDEDMRVGICTKEFGPVCGSDGITYANLCLFCHAKYGNEKEIDFKHTGECKPDDFCPSSSKHEACTYEYNPVCASDGVTYSNLCVLCSAIYRMKEDGDDETFELKIEHYGKCDRSVLYYNSYSPSNADFCEIWKNTTFCPATNKPICGNDSITYPNDCAFCHAMYELRELGIRLVVKFYGQCPDANRCPPRNVVKKGCPNNIDKVCGSNGVTYQNECLLCKDMYDRQAAGENIIIKVDHEGEC